MNIPQFRVYRSRFCSSSLPQRRLRIPLSLLLMGLIAFVAPATMPASAQSSTVPLAQAATSIVVDTSADLDSDSITKTCTFTSGVYQAASDGCTLRRAILEAAARPQSDRPIDIQFNLPITDTNADLEVAGTWTLPIEDSLPPLETDTILDINGQVRIDGDSQPGGRSDGPKIIIDTNDNSLEVESENNLFRNLSIKGGGVIFLKEGGNTVENIWMGLTDDGQSIHFRDPDNERRMAGGGIFIDSDDNVVQDNVISGAFARAVDINSGNSGNIIRRNLIGTRADGTVPAVAETAQCLRSFSYDPQNWYGGWGIAVSGSDNQVTQNRIAGLHILQSANETPPMALEIFGADHLIQENVIGIDSAGAKRGVCGQGIKVAGSGTQILDNVVYGSRAGFEDDDETVILANDSSPTFGQITVRRNLTEDGPSNVFKFGPAVPEILRTFKSAKLTNVDGTTLSGTNGDNSPCPGCLIDFYTDDGDAIGETLSYLGSTTADSNGDFTFTMTDTLPSGAGIRTNSTTQAAGVIGSYGAGTTAATSKLFLPMTSVEIDGPTAGEVGVSQPFTITVSPAQATAPFTYTVEFTDAEPLVNVSESNSIIATATWSSDGVKEVDVTVTNDLGSVSATHEITISGAEQEGALIYLPITRK